VLAILCERLDVSEVYRLGRADLEYIGFFPAEPELTGPEESGSSVDDMSDLGPFATRVCTNPEIILVTNPDLPPE
jgi:hypothetical protein